MKVSRTLRLEKTIVEALKSIAANRRVSVNNLIEGLAIECIKKEAKQSKH
jgi:hypothetical protein